MRGKPLYPWAVIATVGLTLMIVLSFVGVNQKDTLLAEGGGDAPPQQNVETTGPLALGEQAYKASCIGCHGANFDGPMGNLHGLADRHSKDDIIRIIVEGGADFGFPNMPGGLVDAEKAAAITEYLLEATK